MTKEYPILTVSELSQAIKLSLEKTFPIVWLQGEISNCKLNSSGHLYFSIKDANAQISAIMFRPDVGSLKIIPKDGDQVLTRGEINVYPPSGKYQILVRELRPVGLGELLLKLEELKIKLHKKGWFRKERKQSLPKYPKRIGIVTSPTGAAIQDVINVLSRRFSNFHLILNPVRVQGEGAAREIAQGIEQFNQYQLVDVLIVGRGGGSIEDLWPFNEEIVAEAIFNSKIPIISAVGHETDHCIADYVADVRAPTPSAAAELVIAEKSQQLHLLLQIKRRLQQTVVQLIRQDKRRLQGLIKHPLIISPFGLLAPWIQTIDRLRSECDEVVAQRLVRLRLILESKHQLLNSIKPTVKFQHFHQKLEILNREIKAAFFRYLQIHHTSLKQIVSMIDKSWKTKQDYRRGLVRTTLNYKLIDSIWSRIVFQKKEKLLHFRYSIDTINPKNLLTKGYCILFSEKQNCAITSVQSVAEKENVQILLSDGNLFATINDVRPSGK